MASGPANLLNLGTGDKAHAWPVVPKPVITIAGTSPRKPKRKRSSKIINRGIRTAWTAVAAA